MKTVRSKNVSRCFGPFEFVGRSTANVAETGVPFLRKLEFVWILGKCGEPWEAKLHMQNSFVVSLETLLLLLIYPLMDLFAYDYLYTFIYHVCTFEYKLYTRKHQYIPFIYSYTII